MHSCALLAISSLSNEAGPRHVLGVLRLLGACTGASGHRSHLALLFPFRIVRLSDPLISRGAAWQPWHEFGGLWRLMSLGSCSSSLVYLPPDPCELSDGGTVSLTSYRMDLLLLFLLLFVVLGHKRQLRQGL